MAVQLYMHILARKWIAIVEITPTLTCWRKRSLPIALKGSLLLMWPVLLKDGLSILLRPLRLNARRLVMQRPIMLKARSSIIDLLGWKLLFLGSFKRWPLTTRSVFIKRLATGICWAIMGTSHWTPIHVAWNFRGSNVERLWLSKARLIKRAPISSMIRIRRCFLMNSRPIRRRRITTKRI